MTSDEIRDWRCKQHHLVAESKARIDECTLNVELAKFHMLGEIAAQLAELNEHFRKADESVFGVKDRKFKDSPGS